ncbi:hypothetical protein [Serratia ficaria]|uniref:hypothetical protein n=1 Tax=Serratia ficaria TaxID=61651 RepID=UPI0021C79596|nr:hypothetical protein [Serratia ficaria]
MPANELKAFSVQADEFGCIRFAKTHVEARREGAAELEVEFGDIVSCRRAPALDAYAAAGHVPWKVLIEEHGWSQECGYCNRRVHDETEGRVLDDKRDQSFCDIECQARYENSLIDVGIRSMKEAQHG